MYSNINDLPKEYLLQCKYVGIEKSIVQCKINWTDINELDVH